ncbi:PREDICTED: protein ECERIFERUM 1-like [Tarenaya hassleriana]|uniref:protein ECERIFERUM 1-like n=1 Tax=Tarenaya hassleriana TaxID=28532 RepID=UPI00053C2D0D|nr:PREDICTED: protein ECERIFERUM 1-like [Tarenaya hassleriana]
MATKPGILTEWPWTSLGRFKFVIVAPWVVDSTYKFMRGEESERDLVYFLVFPMLLSRIIHNLLWISLSRYVTAKGNRRIVDKGIDFNQVDRETNWDDQILFNGVLFYIGYTFLPEAKKLPMWRTDGVVMAALLHAGPVEFLYYWLHRALHHHFLYSRYHSHHHSSIVTEPITSVTHPFAEHIAYFTLFAIPTLTTVMTKTASMASLGGYIFYIDFMNNMGHCNFEFLPNRLFRIFPLFKFLFYTPSFHSLHHTQFRTNYSLFMPFYDYVYGTTDESTDSTYEKSLERGEETPDVVHLTHLTTPESIYHLPIGFASFSSYPFSYRWFMRLLWPLTSLSMFFTLFYGRPFVSERNSFKNLKLHSWVIPRYNLQYFLEWRKEAINKMIEEAILEADRKGVNVLSLGLMNQGEELNRNGEEYIEKHPKVRMRVVDGSSLAAAVVINSVPKGTVDVVMRGSLTKVAYAIASALCQKGIKVTTLRKDEYDKLMGCIPHEWRDRLLYSTSKTLPSHKIWLVGEGIDEKEQGKATQGSIFIPFSQFPPKELRKDCLYHTTPALTVPKSLENIHSCENWLPRKAISAARAAGIVHALEGWERHECGSSLLHDLDAIWDASLSHGFRPLPLPHFSTHNLKA